MKRFCILHEGGVGERILYMEPRRRAYLHIRSIKQWMLPFFVFHQRRDERYILLALLVSCMYYVRCQSSSFERPMKSA